MARHASDATPPGSTPSEVTPRARKEVSRSDRLGSVIRSGITAAFFLHLGFLFLFLGLEVWLLAAVNVLSVGVYGFCQKSMADVKWLQTVLVITGVEVILHAGIASRVLGWESGFHYYVLALTPLVFLDARASSRIKISVMVILITLYIGISLWTRTVVPLHPLAPEILHGLHYFNMILALVILAMILNVHSHSIQRAEHHLQTLAETDNLTGLPNRRGLLNLADRFHPETAQRLTASAAILIDVDHFKRINDRYGHGYGDSVLKAVARSMQGQIRDRDALARWGGEEFLVLLHDADLELALSVAERIREAVAQLTFQAGDRTLSVTITTGIADWQQDEPLEACIERADDALYHGKTSGRNRSVIS
ncbi:GGDEF domain-containing protein [Vreelandella utahensis]|uniref:GGDEF domain-containing protein n=1 Tax=Vreelandella halophila TaxID=86177 RepID=UPI0009871A7D|nr:GGDEF domain-containing protein [Halomonas utahensis]